MESACKVCGGPHITGACTENKGNNDRAGLVLDEEPEERAERAFWARLEKSGPDAVDAVKKLATLKDPAEKSKFVEQFNQGRKLEGPYIKDGIDLPDGGRVKVNRDQKGNINLGWS